MKLSKVEFSAFKTNGQSMFGSTQRKDWEKEYAVDENGMCSWALRSLFIQHEDSIILIDTGFNNYDLSILEEYSINNFKKPQDVLCENGIMADTVGQVIHTHFHVDHCGGSFLAASKSNFVPSFVNATYYCSKQQLASAIQPTNFEKDSFQPEIITAFSAHNHLQLVNEECFLFPWLELLLFNGHTKGLIVPVIHTLKYSLAFVGDLIPSVAHLRLQSAMNYDINQVLSLTERENFLEDAYENEYILFFQHDYFYECCTLKKEKSRILPAETFKLSDL